MTWFRTAHYKKAVLKGKQFWYMTSGCFEIFTPLRYNITRSLSALLKHFTKVSMRSVQHRRTLSCFLFWTAAAVHSYIDEYIAIKVPFKLGGQRGWGRERERERERERLYIRYCCRTFDVKIFHVLSYPTVSRVNVNETRCCSCKRLVNVVVQTQRKRPYSVLFGWNVAAP